MCAVGWLERAYPYRRGKTPAEVLQKLQKLLSEPLWEPCRSLGYHQCDLGFCGVRLSLATRLGGPPLWLFWSREQNLQRHRQAADVIAKAVARHERRTKHRNERDRTREVARWPDYQALLARAADACSHRIVSLWLEASRLITPIPRVKTGRSLTRLGARNLVIPGKERVYMTPSLVFHYIKAHRYRPSDSFCHAVLDCPPMGSSRYFEAFRPAFRTLDATEFSMWIDRQMTFMAKPDELHEHRART